jgi:photosystem II stability/assembly factor-like uncharacterized protein
MINPRRLVGRVIVTLVLGISGHPVCEASPYTIPAHWTDSTDKVEPVVEDFSFDGMDFIAPNEGWIVGYRFLLHIRNDDLTRTFVDPEDAWLLSVDFLSEQIGWAGGFRHADSGMIEGVIWRYDGDSWVPIDLSSVGVDGWGVGTVRFASLEQGWALGWRDPVHRNDESVVLHYDGESWKVDSYPHTGGRQWSLIDMCVGASGRGWAVGKYRAESDQWRPLVAAVDGGAWNAAEVPTADVATGLLNHVACLPDGKAMASGLGGSIWNGEAILLAYDGSWSRIDLPHDIRPMQIEALAALSLEDYWLSLSKPGMRPLLVHFKDGSWQEVPRPLIPHGGRQEYGIEAMQFVSANEAWAIGIDGNGPGLFRGLVLHYKDGVWRNRNWNWHFWDERWFGLFGR